MICRHCGREMKLTGVDTYYCFRCAVVRYLSYTSDPSLLDSVADPPSIEYHEFESLGGIFPIGYELGC